MGAPPPSPTLDFIQRALSQYIHNYLGRVLGQGAALQMPSSVHPSSPSAKRAVRGLDFAIEATILVDFHVIPWFLRPRLTVQTHRQYSDAGRPQPLSYRPQPSRFCHRRWIHNSVHKDGTHYCVGRTWIDSARIVTIHQRLPWAFTGPGDVALDAV